MPTTPTGFVKLRRGILEHLRDGRISDDEFAAYVVMILAADHHTGVWKGSGKTLGALMNIGWTSAKRILASLEAKGYTKRLNRPRRGDYAIEVRKYFEKPTDGLQPTLEAHGRASISPRAGFLKIQEVEERIQEAPKTPRRVYPREIREAQVRSMALVGQPMEAQGCTIKPEVLKRIQSRR